MKESKRIVGWREWVALPELGVSQIKAKLDTGARTSALHGEFVESFKKSGKLWARFYLYPSRSRPRERVLCEAPVVGQRNVKSSSGKKQERWVVRTTLAMAGRRWKVEFSLARRETMLFRMLLGRTALSGRCCIDPALDYSLGRPKRKKAKGSGA